MNTHELAWAAGFFDGEGSTSLCRKQGRYPFIRMNISQAGERGRFVLERFQNAVRNCGDVRGPYNHAGSTGLTRQEGRYSWDTGRFEHVQAVIAMLWKYLSPVKRLQAASALQEYHDRERTRR